MEELRCPHCNKLLGKADLMLGSRVEIACRTKKCKDAKQNVIKFSTEKIVTDAETVEH